MCIIGGYYDERKQYIKSFLLGVMNKNDSNMDESVFHAIGRVRNGLSRAQMQKIQKKLDPYWHKVLLTKNGRKINSLNPKCIEWNQDPPDVWIEPKNSILLQIKASELVETKTYRTSHTLRFPRIVEIREDKMWYDCCSLDEFGTFVEVSYIVFLQTKKQFT